MRIRSTYEIMVLMKNYNRHKQITQLLAELKSNTGYRPRKNGITYPNVKKYVNFCLKKKKIKARLSWEVETTCAVKYALLNL